MSACHREMVQPGVVLGQLWHRLDDGRIQCDLCPRECKLHEGQRGFCFVRQAQDGGVVLTTYGTFALNVPWNDMLATVEPVSADGATQWASYLTAWTSWNHVRTAAALM